MPSIPSSCCLSRGGVGLGLSGCRNRGRMVWCRSFTGTTSLARLTTRTTKAVAAATATPLLTPARSLRVQAR